MQCGCTRPLINTPPRHKDNALKLPRTSGFTLTFHSLIRIRPRVPPELPKARLHSLQPHASLPSNVKNSDRLHRPHLIHSHAPATSSSSPGARSPIPLICTFLSFLLARTHSTTLPSFFHRCCSAFCLLGS